MEPVSKSATYKPFIDNLPDFESSATDRQKLHMQLKLQTNIRTLANDIIYGNEKLSYDDDGYIHVHSSWKRTTRPITKYFTGEDHYSMGNLEEFVDFVVEHYSRLKGFAAFILLDRDLQKINANFLKLSRYYHDKHDYKTESKFLACHKKIESCLVPFKKEKAKAMSLIMPLNEEDYARYLEDYFSKTSEKPQTNMIYLKLVASAIHYDQFEDFQKLIASEQSSILKNNFVTVQIGDEIKDVALFELIVQFCELKDNPAQYYEVLIHYLPKTAESRALSWAANRGFDHLFNYCLEQGLDTDICVILQNRVLNSYDTNLLQRILEKYSYEDLIERHERYLSTIKKYISGKELEPMSNVLNVVISFLNSGFFNLTIQAPEIAQLVDERFFNGEKQEELDIQMLALKFGLEGKFLFGDKELSCEGFNGVYALNEMAHSLEEFIGTEEFKSVCPLKEETVDKILTALKNGGKFASGKQIWLDHQTHVNLPVVIPTSLKKHFMTMVVWNNLVSKCNKAANERGLVGFNIYDMTRPEKFDEALINRFLGVKKDDRLFVLRGKEDAEFVSLKEFMVTTDKTLGLKPKYTKGTKTQKVGNCPWASSKLAFRSLFFFGFLEEDQSQWRRLVSWSDWDALMDQSEQVFQAWKSFDLKRSAEKSMELKHNPFTLPMIEDDKPTGETLGDIIVNKCREKEGSYLEIAERMESLKE